MRNKMIGAIVLVVLLIVCFIIFMVLKPKREGAFPREENENIGEDFIDNGKVDDEASEEQDKNAMVTDRLNNNYSNIVLVTGSFDSEKEALKAGDKYGIIMTYYGDGIATFQLQNWQNAEDVIQMGIDNGWPLLSIERERDLY